MAIDLRQAGGGGAIGVARLGVLGLVLGFVASGTHGLSIRHDKTQGEYEAFAATDPLRFGGSFTNTSGGLSGTLISPQWVLTAAHNGSRQGFEVFGETRAIVERVVFDGDPSANNAVDGFDFALMRLASPIVPDTDFPGLYSGVPSPITSAEAYFTGAGDVGNGNTGAGSTEAVLAGTNNISQIGGEIGGVSYADNIAFSTFSPDLQSITELEMGFTDGDSGGGIWVLDNTSERVLAGVSSFVLTGQGQPLGLYQQINASTLFTPEVVSWINQTVATLLGDFDDDGQVDAFDIDLLTQAGRDGTAAENGFYDLTGDDLVTNGTGTGTDLALLIEGVLGTAFGDADLDGEVNVVDLGILATHFGQSGGWSEGDFNGDGEVNVVDLGVLATNFGFSAPLTAEIADLLGAGDLEGSLGLAGAAIPEPAVGVLIGGLALIGGGRRRVAEA